MQDELATRRSRVSWSARILLAFLSLGVIAPVVESVRLTRGIGDAFGIVFLVDTAFFVLWLGGSAMLLGLVVLWADRGHGARLVVAALGSVGYALYTAWIYVVLNSGDPLAGFVLITGVPGQWFIVGLVAAAVRLASVIASDFESFGLGAADSVGAARSDPQRSEDTRNAGGGAEPGP